MDKHTATEVAFRNGYNKAVEELRGTATWTKLSSLGMTKYQCSACNNISGKASKFCPDCGKHMNLKK
jgi:predicted amidophosphoribosyltransferase